MKGWDNNSPLPSSKIIVISCIIFSADIKCTIIKTGFNLMIVHFYNPRKLDIILVRGWGRVRFHFSFKAFLKGDIFSRGNFS